MTHLPSLLAGLCAGAFALPLLQDPGKPAAPATTPPAIARTAEDVPGRPPRHPLEGVYELRRRVVDSKPDLLPNRGYLAITPRHLFIHLAAPGPDPDLPLVRAGVRTWKPLEADQVLTVVQLGWYTDSDGDLHVERAKTEERRRLVQVQGGVRLVLDERNWLEFERVE